MPTLYELLEVDEHADERAVKSAFRRMARKHHPDVNPEDSRAGERFMEIAAAFEVLSDPDRRELYDEFGFEGLSPDFDPVRARWARRADDQAERDETRWRQRQEESWSARFKREYDLENSSFKNVFEKAFRDFNPFQHAGTQAEEEQLKQDVFIEPGADVRASLEITFLQGLTGGPVAFAHHDGSTLTIKVPAGVAHGEVLLIKAEGKQPRDKRGEPGDLMLTIHITEKIDELSRDGLDLTLRLPVTMPEAILGARIAIPTPHGECTMALPEGVNSGAKLRLRGMGVHRGEEKGDFFVLIEIIAPTHMNDTLRQLAEGLRDGYATDVRAHIKLH